MPPVVHDPKGVVAGPVWYQVHAGEAKTEAGDAAIIAQADRSLPHALRSLQLGDEQIAEFFILCGFDDDVVGQITATRNRIRGLLTHIRPALEQVLGPHLDHPAVLDLLQRNPSPAAMKAAGTTRLGNRLVKLAPRMGRRLADEITKALAEQTVVVTGTNATSLVLPKLAEQLAALRRQCDEIAVEVERLVEAHPLHPVLMPGVGIRTPQTPHRNLRQGIRHRQPPRRLCRSRTHHPALRQLHPR